MYVHETVHGGCLLADGARGQGPGRREGFIPKFSSRFDVADFSTFFPATPEHPYPEKQENYSL